MTQAAAGSDADDLLLKPFTDTDLPIRLRTADRVQQFACDLTGRCQPGTFRALRDGLTGILNPKR